MNIYAAYRRKALGPRLSRIKRGDVLVTRKGQRRTVLSVTRDPDGTMRYVQLRSLRDSRIITLYYSDILSRRYRVAR